uniref:Uncharacterized protein n=1 Tax=Opuntia streptacantha TaxID=393608 RepID=A0A7C8Z8F7_OPUST
MARQNLMSNFALVFALVLCYRIILAEGRAMKCEFIVEASAKEVEISNHCEGDKMLPNQIEKTNELMPNSRHERLLEEDFGDFRPIFVGHSLRAGHQRQLIEDSEDFGPTAPGRSPGAGHKRHLEDSGDFRPTSPGHSPGAGHGLSLLGHDE